jgi:asparagine synthase (glutamine-hydrolysing)
LPGDILWKSDSAGMMASLEIRTPFLNSKLLRWAEGQDFSKLHSKQTFMMSIYGKEIPPMFFSRKKSGFGAPLSSWFQNQEVERMYLDFVGNSKSKVYDFIDYQRAAKLSKRNIQFKWNLLALTLWLNRNA